MSLPSLYLDAFYSCAQLSNFTKAAQRLHITQSALSQRIKNLEDALATSLFVRDRSGVRLTEAGYALLRYCQSKEAIESEAIAQIKGKTSGGLSGLIRIGGFSSVMRSVVLPALADTLTSNAQLGVSFITKELSELPLLLRRGEVDYVILDHKVEKEDLEAIYLGSEENVLVTKKDSEVPNVFLDHDEDDETTAKFFRHNKMKVKMERRYFDDVYGIIDAAKLGLGKAVLPKHLIKDEKRLSIQSKDKTLSVPVFLHFYKQDYYPKLHQVIVETLVKNCGRFLTN